MIENDGCTYWFDGDWRHCCDVHDYAYAMDTVSLQTHIDLGLCVAGTSGGIIMGIIMALAAIVWWLLRYKLFIRQS